MLNVSTAMITAGIFAYVILLNCLAKYVHVDDLDHNIIHYEYGNIADNW